MATKAEVLAWLDERGWPHDPYELTKEQNGAMRKALGICGHRTRERTPCAIAPMVNGRCRKAGGTARRGVTHPRYEGKGRGKYVPQRWRDRYRRLDRAALMDLTENLAVLELRLQDLLARADPAESGRTFQALKAEWGGLQAALRQAANPKADRDGRTRAEAEVQERVLAISALIGRGAADADAWQEVYGLLEQYRRTADTEVKRRTIAKLFVPAEDAMEDYDALGAAVREVVEHAVDRGVITRKAGNRILTDVGERFARLVALPVGAEPQS